MPLPVLDIEREIAQQGIPTSWQGTYRKALAGNRSAARKAMCGLCMGWDAGARKFIRECVTVGCPNHAVRPFQKKAGSAIPGDTEIDTVNDTDSTDNSEERATEIEAEGSDVLAEVKAKIIEHLHTKGVSQRGYIIFSTGIPESSWNEAIRSLLAEGAIEREGERRNARYRLKEGD